MAICHGRYPSDNTPISAAEIYSFPQAIDVVDPFNPEGEGIEELCAARRQDGRLASLVLRRERSRCEEDAALTPRMLSPEIAPEKTCPICLCEPESPVSFSCKVHLVCQSCAAQYVQIGIADGAVKACPVPQCDGKVTPELAECLLNRQDFEKYLFWTIRDAAKLKTCPHCSADLYLDTPRQTSTQKKCKNCGKMFCISCMCPWHPHATCEQAQEAARKERERVLDMSHLGVKKCPGCKTLVEKSDDGCDHMICTCGYEFCWSCLADRTVIYAHGNHYHHPACKFHFTYDGEPEFLPRSCKRCERRQRPCTPPGRRRAPLRSKRGVEL
mmetsp:Transcript_29252/g.51180  ORF Transcript_29252/g.51180 Transcript_29252/m.51180 type:complete len:328 (-) Transcript_29252:56-1039(-)